MRYCRWYLLSMFQQQAKAPFFVAQCFGYTLNPIFLKHNFKSHKSINRKIIAALVEAILILQFVYHFTFDSVVIFNFLSFFFWVYLQAKNKSTGFVKAFIAYYWPALELRNKQMTIYGKCLEHRLKSHLDSEVVRRAYQAEGFSQM